MCLTFNLNNAINLSGSNRLRPAFYLEGGDAYAKRSLRLQDGDG